MLTNTGNNYPPGEVAQKTVAHDNGGQCLAFNPQGKKIATGGTDGKVKIWDKNLSANVKWMSISQGSVSCISFDFNGDIIAAADSNS